MQYAHVAHHIVLESNRYSSPHKVKVISLGCCPNSVNRLQEYRQSMFRSNFLFSVLCDFYIYLSCVIWCFIVFFFRLCILTEIAIRLIPMLAGMHTMMLS